MSPRPSESLVDGFARSSTVEGHSRATIRRRLVTFRLVCEHHGCDLVDLDASLIESFLGGYEQAATRRAYLADLRAFFRWATARGLVDHDPTGSLRPPRVPSRRPTPLTADEVSRVHEACLGNQDRLAVGFGLYAGLRVSEMAHLRHDDVDLVDRVLHVRQGKGGKDRAVPISDLLADTIGRCGHTMNANVGNVVSVRIKRVFRDGGITGHRPHDLRATFATTAIRAGVDLVTVASWLGHSSVATTQIYVLPDRNGVDLVNRMDQLYVA